MGEKKRRVSYDIKLGPDGWVEVLEGVFPIFSVMGPRRVLIRSCEGAPEVVAVDHPFEVAYALPQPVYIYAGQQWKMEVISAA